MSASKKFKVVWSDESSYRFGERGKIPPTTLEVNCGFPLGRIIVTRRIEDPENTTWFLTARDVNIALLDLCVADLEEAKGKALLTVRARCEQLVAAAAKLCASREKR